MFFFKYRVGFPLVELNGSITLNIFSLFGIW